MLICQTKQELIKYLNQQKLKTTSIGFVPTMGALHKGHLSLLQESKKKCDLTICSIFVNPTQFNDNKDFERYPNTVKEDVQQLKNADINVLFLPSVADMYPTGTINLEKYDLGIIEAVFEGYYRPGHFQGVCQIVHRLLEIVNPNILFLGQKDYQQCMIIKKLITLIQKNIDICIVPTIREDTGLAMSSRNMLLSADAKKQAAVIYRMMIDIKKNIHSYSIHILEEKAKVYLLENGFSKIDYVSIVDANTLEPIDNPKIGQQLVILAATFIQGIRLIDNLLIKF